MTQLHAAPAAATVARTLRDARRPILALALGGFGIGTAEFMAMGLLPQIAGGLGVSEPRAGNVISAYALGVVVGAPLIAALSVRVPRKRLLVALMVLFTVGNVAVVLAPGYGSVVAARFLTGLPHGAFFGVAALVAASLVERSSRARAVAAVMMGLSVANVVGVPLATWAGQSLGWRSTFGVVAGIGLATVAALLVWLPDVHLPVSSPRAELGALARPQVWLTLGVGVVGFGGMFAVYSYITPTLTEVTGLREGLVPLVLAVYGAGMVTGNVLGGWLADRALVPGLFVLLVAMGGVLALFTVTASSVVGAVLTVFAIGTAGSAMVPGLQTRLMDVAADAQTLAASLNHSALNLANAAGAWLGGLVVSAGLGYTAPAWVGAVLAAAGLVVLSASALLQRTRPETVRGAAHPVALVDQPA
ncbi:MFS transporter [Rhodococcus antarcticus]|uniref:MFS transporter n=1 Tax=Rhodococcus antarcticus TaxID=2987751 RepID=UPI003F49065C